MSKNSVTLSQIGNRKVVVPRASIPKSMKVKTGQIVTAVFSPEEIMEKLRQSKKAK